jgi:nucleoside-diphosphate-sugar epimerase
MHPTKTLGITRLGHRGLRLRVLITGGNGFIGSHLADQLIDRNESVSLLDLRFGSNTKSIDCRKIRADIRDFDSVKKAVHMADAVFHFAAVSRVVWGQERPLDCWRTNALGTANILEASRKTKPSPLIVYASSREVYGEPQYLPVDESHPKNPKSVYGTTKLCAERSCLSYYDAFGVKTIILRFSNVYGSERDQLDRVAPKFMLKALRNEPMAIYGGDQVLDFTFIDDTISGILHAWDRANNHSQDIAGEDFHFVTGRGVSVYNLAEMIVKLCGSSSTIAREDSKEFEVQSFIGNPLRSSQRLGFTAKTRLEEGLKILKQRLSSKLRTP